MSGILDRAKQFAKEASNYISSIVGSDNENKSVKKKGKKQLNSVIADNNANVVKPIDTFEKQPSKKQNNIDLHKISKNDVVNVGKEIDALKKQYGISDKEFYEIILPKIGYTKENFLKLSPKQQLEELYTIKGGTNLYIFDKYKDDPNFNKAEIMGNAVADFKKANELGGIKDVKDFNKHTKFYIHKMNKELKSAVTDDEKIEIVSRNRLELEKNINAQRNAELKNCKTDAQRAAVNKKYDARIESFEGYLQTVHLVEHCKPEEAYISTYLRRGNNMADGYERAIKSYSCQAMSRAADSFTHERKINQLQHYNEYGDPISAQVYGEATQIQTQFMSKEGLEKLEEDAYKFKQEFYKNPEKYSFITEEHLTKESVATGMGAVLNKNLTPEQKAEFLKIWNEHAKEFSDYDDVRGQFYAELKQYMEKHPEAKQGIEDIKTKYQEKYVRRFEVPWAAKKRYDNRIQEQKSVNGLSTNGNVQNTQQNQKENNNLTVNATTKDVAQAVKTGAITMIDAIADYHEKAYDAIFEDPELFNRNLTIAKLHINNHRKDLHKLLELSKFSSAVALIAQNISPSIKSEYAKEVNLSGITKDAIFGKDESYAA